MHDEPIDRTAYNLGWDYAMYGLGLPEAIQAISRDGYELGKSHFQGKIKQSDRFIRKWLQLRTNAYRRGRLVNDDVTPKLIAEIDTVTCPVTLLNLTHSERLESDWSVDRLNNNGAYAIENLAVISTKANTAKGNKTFEEVLELANAGEATDGLTPREWLRMACIMYGPSVVEDRTRGMLLPLATKIPNRTVHPEWFKLQYCIVLALKMKTAARNAQHKTLRAICQDPIMQDALDKIFSRLEMLRREYSYPYDAMLDTRVQDSLQKWFLGIDRNARLLLKLYMKTAGDGKPFSLDELKRFSLRTKGYAT
jgi:hypothetical protein